MKLSNEDFAKVLRHTTLHGDSSTIAGLRHIWGLVESEVHDVAHMVVLGKPICSPHSLARVVNTSLMRLRRPARFRNEIKTLAAQTLFFRRVDGFLDEGGERFWLHAVTSVLEKPINSVSVRKDMKDPEVQHYALLLERRLRYHCWASATPAGFALLQKRRKELADAKRT